MLPNMSTQCSSPELNTQPAAYGYICEKKEKDSLDSLDENKGSLQKNI